MLPDDVALAEWAGRGLSEDTGVAELLLPTPAITEAEGSRHRSSARKPFPPPAPTGEWTAILLAGDRPGGDRLAAGFGLRSKALIEVAGMTMLRRVADTLLRSPAIGRVVILAQDPKALMTADCARLDEDPKIVLGRSGDGIATSIAAIAGSSTAPWPLIVTTADHALLTPTMIEELLAGADEVDIAVAVGERRIVESRYPSTRRTWFKFADGHYSGANLFALRGPSAERALALWSSVEQDRKKVCKLFSRFGPWLLLRALTRTIRFDVALARAGARLGLSIRPVVLSAAEAAIDVDTLQDLELVTAILSTTAVR